MNFVKWWSKHVESVCLLLHNIASILLVHDNPDIVTFNKWFSDIQVHQKFKLIKRGKSLGVLLFKLEIYCTDKDKKKAEYNDLRKILKLHPLL